MKHKIRKKIESITNKYARGKATDDDLKQFVVDELEFERIVNEDYSKDKFDE